MWRKKILKYSDLIKSNVNVQTSPSDQVKLTANIELGKNGHDYARQYIKEDGSSTQVKIKDRNTLFSLEKKILENRKLEYSFDEAFYLYLLTSKDSSAVAVRLKAYDAQKYKLGNCGELSYLSAKYLRRYDRNIYILSIVDSDHVVVMIGNPDNEECVILDTLNQKIYPLSEIYKNLQCYYFDENQIDPHVLTPFKITNELEVECAIPCFKNLEHNENLAGAFYKKLKIIKNSFERFSNDKAVNKIFAESLKSYKLEIKGLNLSNCTNLETERFLDRKIKSVIILLKKYIDQKIIIQKKDFYFDIILNMRSLYPDDLPYTYFKHLIYFEPIFSKVLDYIKNGKGDPVTRLKYELEDKKLLDALLKKLVTMACPSILGVEPIRMLLDAGADPFQDCDDNNVLTWAVINDVMDIVKYLIDHHLHKQINIFKICDSQGFFPLTVAAELERTEMIKCMLNKMPELIDQKDKDGLTAIHFAAENGSVSLCQLLLGKRANITLRTKEGSLPIHLAVKNGSLEIIKLMINYKRSIINSKNGDGLTPLHLAADNDHLDIVKELVKRGASLRQESTDNHYLPIHFAAHSGNPEIVRWMLNVDPMLINCEDEDHWNLLHFACNSGNNMMVQELLEDYPYLLKPTKEEGYFPIHVAAKEGDINIVELVLKKAPTLLDCVDKKGCTPLHIAVFHGHLDLVEVLLNQGANLTIKNNKGNTPLDMTKKLEMSKKSRANPKIIEQIVSLLNKYNPINQVSSESTINKLKS